MHPHEWQQSGSIYLWSYEANPKYFRGYHLHCCELGSDSLVSLILSMEGAGSSAKRTVTLSEPTKAKLLVPGCGNRPINFKKLIVANSDRWALSSEQEKAYLFFCNDDVSPLVDAISGIKEGKGDFTIGTPGNELWFWW